MPFLSAAVIFSFFVLLIYSTVEHSKKKDKVKQLSQNKKLFEKLKLPDNVEVIFTDSMEFIYDFDKKTQIKKLDWEVKDGEIVINDDAIAVNLNYNSFQSLINFRNTLTKKLDKVEKRYIFVKGDQKLKFNVDERVEIKMEVIDKAKNRQKNEEPRGSD
jgi:hypothetical protein